MLQLYKQINGINERQKLYLKLIKIDISLLIIQSNQLCSYQNNISNIIIFLFFRTSVITQNKYNNRSSECGIQPTASHPCTWSYITQLNRSGFWSGYQRGNIGRRYSTFGSLVSSQRLGCRLQPPGSKTREHRSNELKQSLIPRRPKLADPRSGFQGVR